MIKIGATGNKDGPKNFTPLSFRREFFIDVTLFLITFFRERGGEIADLAKYYLINSVIT